MKQSIPLYQVDAFSAVPFSGNPAAVCPLDAWLPDEVLQAIAAENNLSETAFIVPQSEPGQYDLRWFTPAVEVDLCGHATLATAHVLFQELDLGTPSVTFHSRSGPLVVTRQDGTYTMDFPAVPVQKAEDIPIGRLLGVKGHTVGKAMDYLIRVESEAVLHAITPAMDAISKLNARGLIVTAPASTSGLDFVSRFFAPQSGVPEDPVTGSAHCTLAPYWAQELGKTEMAARQIGPRGGELRIRLEGERVYLTGEAVTVMSGQMYLP